MPGSAVFQMVCVFGSVPAVTGSFRARERCPVDVCSIWTRTRGQDSYQAGTFVPTYCTPVTRATIKSLGCYLYNSLWFAQPEKKTCEYFRDICLRLPNLLPKEMPQSDGLNHQVVYCVHGLTRPLYSPGVDVPVHQEWFTLQGHLNPIRKHGTPIWRYLYPQEVGVHRSRCGLADHFDRL